MKCGTCLNHLSNGSPTSGLWSDVIIKYLHWSLLRNEDQTLPINSKLRYSIIHSTSHMTIVISTTLLLFTILIWSNILHACINILRHFVPIWWPKKFAIVQTCLCGGWWAAKVLSGGWWPVHCIVSLPWLGWSNYHRGWYTGLVSVTKVEPFSPSPTTPQITLPIQFPPPAQPSPDQPSTAHTRTDNCS